MFVYSVNSITDWTASEFQRVTSHRLIKKCCFLNTINLTSKSQIQYKTTELWSDATVEQLTPFTLQDTDGLAVIFPLRDVSNIMWMQLEITVSHHNNNNNNQLLSPG